MNAISCRDVDLRMGDRLVLHDVNLDIARGEFVGVLGPNGSGKTTLMRAVLGLIAPSRGSIRVLDRPAKQGNPEIGYLPQLRGAAAGLHLTGRDFLAAAVNGHRLGLPIPGKAGRREIERVLVLIGAQELAARPLGEMSGGEQQRLSLAQALLGNPKLLLLDEPLTSLDPHRQAEVIALVKSLQRALDITVLFSSHELNPLLGAMDRVLYLGSGHAALGKVEEVVTGAVLSRLYGTEIEVLRVNGRIFVMSGAQDVESAAHRHGNGGHAPENLRLPDV